MDEFVEVILAEGGLDVAVVAAGAKAQPAEFDAGLAQRHLVHRGAFAGLGDRGADAGKRPRRQQRGAGQKGGISDKLAAVKSVAFHA